MGGLTTSQSELIWGNQSGCKKAKTVEFLLFMLWVFLTIYICVALMKITTFFRQLEASYILSCDS